jgi:hypothetical protein
MALTLAQKSNVRRHLKFPVVGNLNISPAGGAFATGFQGFRFFQAYGAMEFRLNNLAADEEARLVGRAYAAAALVGPQPNPGDTVSVTLSGGNIASPQTLTTIAPAAVPGVDARLPMVMDLAAQCNRNAVLQAALVLALSPYGTGPLAQNAIPIPEVSFTSPVQFTIAATGSGVLSPGITATGAFLTPTTSLDGGITTIWGYLPILDGLENAYATTSDNLDTSRADVWYGMSNELGKRRSLYESWVALMADFLGIPSFSQAKQRPAQTGAVRYV